MKSKMFAIFMVATLVVSLYSLTNKVAEKDVASTAIEYKVEYMLKSVKTDPGGSGGF